MLIGLIFLALSSGQSFASSEISGACANEFKLSLMKAKKEFLQRFHWEYDHEYDIKDVHSVTAFENEDLVEVKIFYDLGGPRELVSTYLFEFFFSDQTKSRCERVEYNLEY